MINTDHLTWKEQSGWEKTVMGRITVEDCEIRKETEYNQGCIAPWVKKMWGSKTQKIFKQRDLRY